MRAIVPVNKMVIRGLNIILLMSTGVIAAGVVIVYDTLHNQRSIWIPGTKSKVENMMVVMN
jgi:hypothetical protein